ncbi:MAG TPA: BON domain-containing protein [Verrucomicrobiae bacterium]|jgi:osmotically-inducible protein OsmY|nr:BON domain-containing protein [Verrucomicrobiae bacterium]
MLNAICKKMLLVALPLGLAVGCAENRPATESAYAPAPDVALAPTSARPEERIYNNGEATVEESQITVSQPPGGANPATWAVAEEIRQKLTSDPSLAPVGSALIAEVGRDGVVTVRGAVSSRSEEQRVCNTLAALPGVQGINNQLAVGSVYNSGRFSTH